MEHILEGLVTRYERGQCTRPELLASLGMLVALPRGQPVAAEAPPFRCRELNHVTLRVQDLGRSKQFYSKLLGLPVLNEDKDSCRLGLGRGFLSLWLDPAPGVDHWCVGVESFPTTRAGARDTTRDSVRHLLAREGFPFGRTKATRPSTCAIRTGTWSSWRRPASPPERRVEPDQDLRSILWRPHA